MIVLPGSLFGPGGEGFFRVSFIVSPERLREAATRAVSRSEEASGAVGRCTSCCPAQGRAIGDGARLMIFPPRLTRPRPLEEKAIAFFLVVGGCTWSWRSR